MTTSVLTAPGCTRETMPGMRLRAENFASAVIDDQDDRRGLDHGERLRARLQAEVFGALVRDGGDDLLAAGEFQFDLVIDCAALHLRDLFRRN